MSDKLKSLMTILGLIDELCRQAGSGINKKSTRPPPKKSLLPGTVATDMAHFSQLHNAVIRKGVQHVSYNLDAWNHIINSLVSADSVLNA